MRLFGLLHIFMSNWIFPKHFTTTLNISNQSNALFFEIFEGTWCILMERMILGDLHKNNNHVIPVFSNQLRTTVFQFVLYINVQKFIYMAWKLYQGIYYNSMCCLCYQQRQPKPIIKYRFCVIFWISNIQVVADIWEFLDQLKRVARFLDNLKILS